MIYEQEFCIIKLVITLIAYGWGFNMSEGIKETQHTRIEVDEDNKSEIEMLYSFGVVIFEHVILSNDKREVSICYFAPSDVYDIVVIDKKNSLLLKYETCNKLNEKYLVYFNLINHQSIVDEDDGKLICGSHSVEYTL